MALDVEPETEDRTVTFDAIRWPVFEDKMARLVKLAKKLDVPPMSFTVLGRGTRSAEHQSGVRYEVDTVTVRLEGETPCLPGGWSFVGAVEHSENGNLLHGDDPVMASYRMSEPDCEHCWQRRARTKTVILRNEAGEVRQIGSTCLKDFLGYHGSFSMLLRLLNEARGIDDEMDDDRPQGRRIEPATPTDVFMTIVAACVRTHGWVPKSLHRGVPTAEMASYVLGDLRVDKYDKELQAMVAAVKVAPKDREEAAAVRAWVATIPADTADGYFGNLRVALCGTYVLLKHQGIAASAVSARRKAEEREEKRAVERKERAASEFVGEVGKRSEFTATVTFVRAIESDYGTSYLVSMVDDSGNVLKTFSSGAFGREAAKGDRAKFKGTVKSHELYEGSKQTMLSRVSLPEWINQEGEGS